MLTLQCSKCLGVKILSQFHKDKNNPSGYTVWCKACKSKYDKQRRIENLEEIEERERQYRKNNREKIRERNRQYSKNNREKMAEKTRQWRKDNPGRNHQWCKDNPNYHRQYRKEHTERYREHKQCRRARQANAPGNGVTAEQFIALCEAYGNICLRCGRGNVKLTIDHVIPLSKGGAHDISNIQPLCRKCNSSKMTKSTDYR